MSSNSDHQQEDGKNQIHYKTSLRDQTGFDDEDFFPQDFHFSHTIPPWNSLFDSNLKSKTDSENLIKSSTSQD